MLAVPHQQELYQRILASKIQLHQIVASQLNVERKRLDKLISSYPLATPERLYRPFTERLIQMDIQLENTMKYYLLRKSSKVQEMKVKIEQHSPAKAIEYSTKSLEQLTQALTRATFSTLEQQKQSFMSTIRTLEALNPLTIMNRGFTVPYVEGKVVKSVEQLKLDDEIKLDFHDGFARAKILAIESKVEGES